MSKIQSYTIKITRGTQANITSRQIYPVHIVPEEMLQYNFINARRRRKYSRQNIFEYSGLWWVGSFRHNNPAVVSIKVGPKVGSHLIQKEQVRQVLSSLDTITLNMPMSFNFSDLNYTCCCQHQSRASNGQKFKNFKLK